MEATAVLPTQPRTLGGTSWHSYPSIYNLGHRAIRDLLDRDVNVEEKVDGSQFSFGAFQTEDGYDLRVKSKGAMIYADAPPGLFKGAVETARNLFAAGMLTPGWTYRAEALQKPKHNSLTYDRIPAGHIIVFDVETGEQDFLCYEAKQAEAARLGLECVALIYSGRVADESQFRAMLDRVSVLGGQNIEGVVIKPRNYDFFGLDHKVLFGKYVSEAFREVHVKAWRESNPTRGDIVEKLIDELSSPARFQKAVIHLREEGKITDSVKDIGAIIAEVKKDIAKEENEFIAHRLYRHFADDIIRRASQGVPQWWKDELVKAQFEGGEIPLREMHASVTITPAMCEASLRPTHGVGAVEDDTPYDHALDVATAEGMPEPVPLGGNPVEA